MVSAARIPLLCLLTAAACEQRPAVSPDRAPGAVAPRRPALATLRVTDGPDGPEASRFHIFDVHDVSIEVQWNGAAAREGQILEIYTPDGTVYRAERAPAGAPLRCLLPVAGTSISRHAIVGRWSAELRLEGGGGAIAVAEFDLLAQSADE